MTGSLPPVAEPDVVSPTPNEAEPPRHPHAALDGMRSLAAMVIGLVAVNRLALVPPAMPANDLDGGARLALNHAFLTGRVVGRDVVHAFGPLGFLHQPLFDPALYGWCLAFGVALALVVTANVTLLARRAHLPASLMALWGVALILLAAPDPDGRFYLLCFLGAWVGIDEHERPGRTLLAANAVVFAATALTTFTHFVTATLLVVLTSLRNGPLPVVVFAVVATVLWLATGQSAGDLLPWIRTSIEFAAGHAETMVGGGPIGELIVYLAGALALIGLLGVRAAHAHDPWRWVALAYMTVLLVVILRHAFAPHSHHALTAMMGIMVASVLAAGACWEWRRTPVEVGFVVVAIGAIVFMTASHLRRFYTPLLRPAGLLAQTVGHLPRLGGIATGWKAEHDAWAAALSRIADDHPVPASARGTLDVLGWQTAIPLASALPWDRKPVAQQFAAATPALAALNARHVAARGAETLLADLTSIGQRPLMLDLGPTALEVLRHYHAVEEPGEFLVLERRTAPRDVTLEPLGSTDARLDQRVPLPAVDAPIWVRIDVHRTFEGHLRGALLKPPLLLLDLELVDGSTRRYSLFPSMSRSGFLLSPLIVAPNGLGALMTNDVTITRDYGVRALTVREIETSGSYAEPIRIAFDAVRFVGDTPPARDDRGVALPLSVVDGSMNLRLGADAGGLVADGVAPGAWVALPFVAASDDAVSRWLDLDVDVPSSQVVRVQLRRAGEQFARERSVAFQLSAGRQQLRVPLPLSTMPVQVRVDPGVRPGRFRIVGARQGGVAVEAATPGPIRMNDVAVRGLPGWFLPFRSPESLRPLDDRWAFEPVAATPAAVPGQPFPLDGARTLDDLVPRPDPRGVVVDVTTAGGGIVLGAVPPAADPRLLELRLDPSVPATVRLWWTHDGDGWDRTRTLVAYLDGSPSVLRVPVPPGSRQVSVRLDVDGRTPGTLRVGDARLLPGKLPADH